MQKRNIVIYIYIVILPPNPVVAPKPKVNQRIKCSVVFFLSNINMMCWNIFF